jgi:hypothetical protein
MMVRLMRMIPPLVSTEVSSQLHGSIGTHGTSDTDGLVAAFRLFRTQRNAPFTLSPNTKKCIPYFHQICPAIAIASSTKNVSDWHTERFPAICVACCRNTAKTSSLLAAELVSEKCPLVP